MHFLKDKLHKTIALALSAIFLMVGVPMQVFAEEAVLHGFRLVQSGSSTDFDADLFLYEHEQSGGSVLYVDSSDEEKFFGIGFKTPPEDSMGVPHVFEHAILQGSKNYPVKALFSMLDQYTASSFLNALTYNSFTLYPIASYYEKDFQNLMTIYLDAVFFPNVLQDENIFRQEGIRLEADSEGNLSYNGVVYSEMETHMADPGNLLYYKSIETLYPDTPYKHISGGNPADLEDLTYGHVIEIHDKYYVPENALAVVYGNQDIDKTLEIIGGYYSNFNKTGFSLDLVYQEPMTQTQYASVSIPGSGPESGQVYVNYVMPDNFGEEDHLSLGILALLLTGNYTSPLSERLFASGLADDYGISYEARLPQQMLSFYATNINPEDAGAFETLLTESLTEILEEGFTQEYINSVFSSYEFSNAMSVNYSNLGLYAILSAVSSWVFFDDPTYELNQETTLATIKDKADAQYFTALIDNLILSNSYKSVVTGVPNANFAQARQSQIDAKLAALKAEMSEEEIAALQESTERFYRWQAQEPTASQLATIPKLSVSDFAGNDIEFNFTVENYSGTKLIHSEAATNNVGYVSFYFDGNTVKQEDLHYAALAALLMGSLETANVSLEEMNLYQNNIINGFSVSLNPISNYYNVNQYDPYITVSFLTLDSNIGEAMDLTVEILKNTKFSNTDYIRDLIANYLVSIDSMGSYLSLYYLLSAQAGQTGLYSDYVNGTQFLDFLYDIINADEEEWAQIAQKLNTVKSTMFTGSNLTIDFTGSAEDFQSFKGDAIAFSNKFYNTKTEPQNYQFDAYADKLAVKYAAQRLNVAQSANIIDAGIAPNGSHKVVSSLVSMNYLWPIIREKNGAYGISCSISTNGFVQVVSNSDPNLDETLAVYATIADYLSQFTMESEDFDSMLVSTVSSFDSSYKNTGKWGLGASLYLSGVNMDDVNTIRIQILETTTQDIQNASRIFHYMNANQKYIVTGSEILIENSSELFDAIY